MQTFLKPLRTVWASALAIVLVSVAGCADAAPETSSTEPHIIVTHSILADLTSEVVGDRATVSSFIPVGIDPHGFSPSTKEVAAFYDADLIIENGLGFEETVAPYVRAAARDGVPVLTVGDVVDPLTVEDLYGPDGEHDHAGEDHTGDGDERDHEHVHEHDHEHKHGPYDPHFWHDIERVKLAVEAISNEIGSLGLVTEDELRADTAAFLSELDELATELRAVYDTVPSERRVLVSQHRVLGYLAHAYGFRLIGSLLPGTSTMAQANAADLARLITAMGAADIPVIFTDVTQSDSLAATVQAESRGHIDVIPLYTESLSPADGPAATYAELMRENAKRIAEGLSK